MLETIVERLEGLPEGDHIIEHCFRRVPFDEDVCDEVGDGLHLGLAHAKASEFDGAQSSGLSAGIRFLLVMMLARARCCATCNPPPNCRTSAIIWWVVVYPLCAPSMGMPRWASAAPSAWALRTIWAM